MNIIDSKWKKDKSKSITVNGKTIYGVGESEIDKFYFREEYGIKESDLSIEEFKFIKLYSDDGYKYLNDYLRDVKNINEPIKKLKIKNQYSELWDAEFKGEEYYINFNNALNTSKKVFKKGKPLKEDILLVRRQKIPLINFSKNNIYHSNSFFSTSISIKVKPKEYGDYLEFIIIPKGNKIMYIEGITATPEDFEVLFDRNVKLKLIEMKSDFLTYWIML